MDPNANYNRQIELARLIDEAERHGKPIDPEHTSELAELD